MSVRGTKHEKKGSRGRRERWVVGAGERGRWEGRGMEGCGVWVVCHWWIMS